MPRKSAAALAVRAPDLIKSDRLPAPAHLSQAEQGLWLEVVNDQPAGAFTPTHGPLLEGYCRHTAQARLLADEILNFDRAWIASDEGLRRFDKLLGMHEREMRAASSLATRLRITRQSVDDTVVARSLVNAQTTRKPWEL